MRLIILSAAMVWGGLSCCPLLAQDAKTKEIATQIRAGELDCPLDQLVTIPAVWALTPGQLDTNFKLPDDLKTDQNPYFSWLTQGQDRAHFLKQPFSNLKLNLSVFDREVPVEEAIVDFDGGKLNGVTLSIYNRADSGNVSTEEFRRRFTTCQTQITNRLGAKPFRQTANPAQGMLTEGWRWTSEKGMALLECNPEAAQGQMEFIRLRIFPRGARGGLAAAMSGNRAAALNINALKQNVTRAADGDVYVKGVPMVDQGPKGYCVVASAQRLLEYFGIPCDQHQLAQIAETNAESGTDPSIMSEALGKIDYRFKTRFKELIVGDVRGMKYNVARPTNPKPANRDEFVKLVSEYVDQGIPLFWGLALGLYQEEPQIVVQQGGYHMRLITGYNQKTGKLIFSDSWGAGHEMKRMSVDDAYNATTCVFVMQPTTR